MDNQYGSGRQVRYPKHRPAARQVATALAVATGVVRLTPSLAPERENEGIIRELVPVA